MIFTIVHYNTPELTMACVMSIIKHNGKDSTIYIFDNSDKYKFGKSYASVHVIDNTTGGIINFDTEVANFIEKNNVSSDIIEHERQCSNFGSFKHSLSVEWLLTHANGSFVLLDSDVLVKHNLESICDHNYAFVSDVREPTIRIFPFITYFNTKMLRDNDIHFCDKVNIYPNYSTPKNDTGGFFLQSVINKQLPYKKISYNDYVVHYGNGSWKTNATSAKQNSGFNCANLSKEEWLTKYRQLYRL